MATLEINKPWQANTSTYLGYGPSRLGLTSLKNQFRSRKPQRKFGVSDWERGSKKAGKKRMLMPEQSQGWTWDSKVGHGQRRVLVKKTSCVGGLGL